MRILIVPLLVVATALPAADAPPSYTFTTLAGIAGGPSFADGPGDRAQFHSPFGVAVDPSGNTYVADTNNAVIRRISATGEVTTLAGLASGAFDARIHADGTGSAARFNFPLGLAIDATGNLFVTDNQTIRRITPAGVVTTIAGSPGVSGSTNGSSDAARFNGPSGLAVDAAGNLYIADTGNHVIRRRAPDGTVTTVAGLANNPGFADGTGNAARFSSPFGIAIASDGAIFVADTGNHVIRRLSVGGQVATIAGAPGQRGYIDDAGTAARFSSPWGLTVNAAGNLYVADSSNHSIRHVTRAGVVTTHAGDQRQPGFADGVGSSARFNRPFSVAIDGGGNLLVTDSDNHLVRKVTPQRVVSTVAGMPDSTGTRDGIGDDARFETPYHVAVDNNGIVYVADSSNHTIRRIGPGGVVTLLAGAPGISGSTNGTGGNARFSLPRGIGVDGTGNVLVADTNNQTIRRITPAGVVTTIAGSPGESGSADGTGSAARFRQPADVAADAAGNLYVADQANHVVRRITPAGVVSVFAGSPGSAGTTDGTGPAARFTSPSAIDVDAAGNVYVTDASGVNHRIRKITPAGVVSTLAGQAFSPGYEDGPGNQANFNHPYGLAVDAAGNVFVGDASNHVIRRISAAGVVSTVGGLAQVQGNADGTGSAARFYLPRGVAVDRVGNLYVADSLNNAIRWGATAVPVLSSAPSLSPLVGQNIAYVIRFSGTLTGPYTAEGLPPGVTYDPDTGAITGAPTAPGVYGVTLSATNGAGVGTGTLTITVTGVPGGDHSYTFTSLAGTARTAGTTDGTGAAARFDRPTGVAVDRSGNVYVADRFNHTIRRITPGGTVALYAGAAGASGATNGPLTAARFSLPDAIVIDPNGNLYVSEAGNHTIRRISTSGAVTTFAGREQSAGTADGIGAAARFNTPGGMAFDSAGNLYVADTNNHTVRRISRTGEVSTFAGIAGRPGDDDGPRATARFNAPWAVAVDPAGNVYVADSGNHTIRRIAPEGVVTTFAGAAGSQGFADGTGGAARFRSPVGIVADRAGNLYVIDSNNYLVRKITSTGIVSTLAGTPTVSGSTNGLGPAARFDSPTGIALDSAGNLYVADTLNHLIRWGALLPPSLVSATTAAGAVGQRFSYSSRFSGALAGPFSAGGLPDGLEIDTRTGIIAGTPRSEGTFTVTLRAINGAGSGSGTLRITVAGAPPTLTAQPAALAVSLGESARFTVVAGGSAPLSYQWRKNGVPLPGATQSSFTLPNPTAADAGSYSVTVTNSLGAITSAPATLTVVPLSALSNLSVRTALPAGQILIVGAVVTGGPKEILMRAAGPALNQFNLAGLADPRLEFFTGADTPVAVNEDWPEALGGVFVSLGAFPFQPGSRDAALSRPVEGPFTVQTRGPGAGTVLVEAYDAAGGFLPRMINVSARNQVGTGSDILIAGFAVAGTGTKQLLIRAVGPTLTGFGVTGALTDPRLQVFNSAGTVIAANDNWEAGLAPTFTQVGAFPLNAGSRDAALLVTLSAGASYTVQVDGVGGTTGEALVEIYEVF